MFVASIDEGYLQLKNEDGTESDLFDVEVNHCSVVARKILQVFLLVWYCNNLGTSVCVEWFISAVRCV